MDVESETRKPFEPKGEKPYWQQIYELIRPLEIGDLITYDTLAAGVDFDFHKNRSMLYQAMRELQKVDKRTLINVPGKGYRVADPREHEKLARTHQQRGKKQIGVAIEKLKSADRTKLSKSEGDRFDAMELMLGRQMQALVNMHSRIRATEEAVEENRRRQEESERNQADMNERLAKMAEALRRHGFDPE